MNKSILITGCSSGIGLDAARKLKSIGWRVFATCRKQSDCTRLSNFGLESFVLDYRNEKTISKAVAKISLLTGNKLDALFNNGAYALPGAVEDLPRDALRDIFEVNFFGYVDLINKSLPLLRNSPDGRVINCSSVLGFTALPYRGAYSATKFALEAITDTLRREETSASVKFVLIEPGPIRTSIRENSIEHFEKWIDWRNSYLSNTYVERIIPRIYASSEPTVQKQNFFELEPQNVTKKLILALNSRHPKKRYFVTYPTHLANIITRFLPTALQDFLLR